MLVDFLSDVRLRDEFQTTVAYHKSHVDLVFIVEMRDGEGLSHRLLHSLLEVSHLDLVLGQSIRSSARILHSSAVFYLGAGLGVILGSSFFLEAGLSAGAAAFCCGAWVAVLEEAWAVDLLDLPLMWCKTSSFMTRPPFPVPLIFLMSRLCSLTKDLTAGVARVWEFSSWAGSDLDEEVCDGWVD